MLTNITYPDYFALEVLSLKVTLPPSLALRLNNIDLFPVMCLEHPLWTKLALGPKQSYLLFLGTFSVSLRRLGNHR